PMDFALWKAAKPGEPSWESPWGAGRPGWHMECSTMSLKYLGETLDIHGGGRDLIFPHHENEIAQTEAYTGTKPFVRHWMHNGTLQLGAEKMSKSLGNLVTIKELLSQYSADAFRLFVLGSHYRSPLTYSDDALRAMEKGAARLRAAVQQDSQNGGEVSTLDAEPFKQRFIEAMDDDFNTAQAVAALFDLATEINRSKDGGINTREAAQTLEEFSSVLGLTLEEAKVGQPLDPTPFMELLASLDGALQQAGLSELAAESELIDSDAVAIIDRLISVRSELRKAKEWKLADEVRAKLSDLGVALEDKPGGTIWKRR
ncbi:MAG: DALR domain-containing protein, partial [Dehalococcoidia bacterium]